MTYTIVVLTVTLRTASEEPAVAAAAQREGANSLLQNAHELKPDQTKINALGLPSS